MLIADIRHHINTSYVIPHEFVALCAGNMQACNLLGYLFWWSDWVETNKPDRKGWTWQTAADLFDGLKLTRRGYQKARDKLLELGVIQYRRGGVFGRMHWKLNKEKLLELVYRVRGEEPPEWASKYQHDTDNFRLPKWVPLDLWNAYLKMRSEAKHPVKHAQKKTLLKQLTELNKAQLDLRAIMEKSILAGWNGFFAPRNQSNTAQPPTKQPTKQPTLEEVNKQIAADRAAANTKPPDKNPDAPDRQALLEKLKTLKKSV